MTEQENSDQPTPVALAAAAQEHSNQTTGEPGKHDVLLGRGGEANNHSGNIKFRQTVLQYRDAYQDALKIDKPHVARELVAHWRSLDPPGRFLVKTGVLNQDGEPIWAEAGDKAAQKRASKNLGERERKRSASSQDETSDLSHFSSWVAKQQQGMMPTMDSVAGGVGVGSNSGSIFTASVATSNNIRPNINAALNRPSGQQIMSSLEQDVEETLLWQLMMHDGTSNNNLQQFVTGANAGMASTVTGSSVSSSNSGGAGPFPPMERRKKKGSNKKPSARSLSDQARPSCYTQLPQQQQPDFRFPTTGNLGGYNNQSNMDMSVNFDTTAMRRGNTPPSAFGTCTTGTGSEHNSSSSSSNHARQNQNTNAQQGYMAVTTDNVALLHMAMMPTAASLTKIAFSSGGSSSGDSDNDGG